MKGLDNMTTTSVIWVYKKDDDAQLKWVKQAGWADLPARWL